MDFIVNGRDYSSFVSSCHTFGLEVTREQLEQLDCYYNLLIEKNKVMNLTAITDFEDVLTKHFIDSISLYHLVTVKKMQPDFLQDKSLVDLGTGAGFPGIPLKIMFPELRVTLMDSLNKRILFLQDVIANLGLHNIEAIHGRAEDLARDQKYRECFDFCVSRAVATISTLSEYCLPFVKVSGFFISYKSGQSDEEIKSGTQAIKILGGNIQHIDSFYLPDSELGRSLVVISKDKSTGKKYPRKAGTPSKEPLA